MNKKKLAEQIIDCNFDQIWTEIRNTLEKVFNTIFHLIIWICKIPNERFMAFYIWLMNFIAFASFRNSEQKLAFSSVCRKSESMFWTVALLKDCPLILEYNIIRWKK